MGNFNSLFGATPTEENVAPAVEPVVAPTVTEPVVEQTPVVPIKSRGDGTVDIINFENISHVFNKNTKNEFVLFDNFSLTIQDIPGDFQSIAIMGPSGSGKSMCLRALAGLTEIQSGNIKIYNTDYKQYGNIPMCFQQPGLYPWMKVIEQVMLPMIIKGVSKKQAYEKAINILSLVGLTDKKDVYPNSLSGGQAQRCNLARALASNAFNSKNYMLLLDECTSALDIKMKRDVQNVILDILYSTEVDPTIISVTHNIEEALYTCNKVIVMQSNPCKVYKVFDIHYNSEGDGPNLKKRGDWIFKTEEYIKYSQELNDALNSVCNK